MSSKLFSLLLPVLAACILAQAGCAPTQDRMPVRQHLLYGSEAALYAGCVRGVIRWHHAYTGHWPWLAQVEALCTDVQKSFIDDWRDRMTGAT